MSLGADMWFEAFCSRWLVAATPEVLTIEKAPICRSDSWSSLILFVLGWILFGPEVCAPAPCWQRLSVARVLGGASCLFAAQPPFGVPLGLAVAALGVWLIRTDSATDRAARVQASTD
jgi:hypothetical protein